jgi:hypothetical protein
MGFLEIGASQAGLALEYMLRFNHKQALPWKGYLYLLYYSASCYYKKSQRQLPCFVLFCFSYLFHLLFGGTRVCPQSLGPARQVFSHLSHVPRPRHWSYEEKVCLARHLWLTPILQGTWKADSSIKKIEVWNQSEQIVCETLSQNNPSQKKAGGVTQVVGPEFKFQYHTHTKKFV